MRIGIFDSGLGGLTVLRALKNVVPSAEYIYLGDTARTPYGTKSQATIVRYSKECAGFLLKHKVDVLVVACNTASAMALQVSQLDTKKHTGPYASRYYVTDEPVRFNSLKNLLLEGCRVEAVQLESLTS